MQKALDSAMNSSSISPEPAVGSVVSSTPDGTVHTLRWVEWGHPSHSKVLICAHGLFRNGRDFDCLAQALMDQYRVICPDFPGRGQSDWLAHPIHYHNEQYNHDIKALIETLQYEQLDWVGTSMGGLIGMGLASASGHPVRRMVINDVGPFISKSALERIRKYASQPPRFSAWTDAEAYFRTTYAGFGPLADRHFAHLVEHGVRPSPDHEGYVLNLDPAVMDRFMAMPCEDIAAWEYWDSIQIPVLILRGESSDILTKDVMDEMVQRHPRAAAIEIPDCAHAPSLMVEPQIQYIRQWLCD